MKILAIESSATVAGIAVAEDDTLIGEYNVNFKKTHSQTLLPMIDKLAEMIDLDFSTLDAIAVSGGPGSFTGLRIGSATAKGLAMAIDKPIIAVPTVEALAANVWGFPGIVCPIMDARRNQVYTGLYRFENGELTTVKDQCAVGIDEIVAAINELGQPVVFTGDGIPVHKAYIEENCTAQVMFAPVHMNRQSGGALAHVAMQYAKAGKFTKAGEHAPDYLRVSQAERERANKTDEA